MALEQPQSLLKRSTSIWRRFSKRDQDDRPKVPPENVRPPKKLHRRTTEPARENPNKRHMITHLQRIEVLAKRPKPKAMPRRRVTATQMQTSSFPASSHVRTVAWNVFLTPEQVYRLVMGFAPQEMEDKWFIYAEGPDMSGKLKLHFHRSWTGMKIAELFVVIDIKGEGAGKIVGIKWNGTDQTNGMDEEEAKYMVSTTCSWVLGVDLEKNML